LGDFLKKNSYWVFSEDLGNFFKDLSIYWAVFEDLDELAIYWAIFFKLGRLIVDLGDSGALGNILQALRISWALF
jgi:hypothetical protein